MIVWSRGDCADASFGLFEPAFALGVDEPPAVFDEFAPSVALGGRDGELRFKLVVNRFVVEDNCVSVLVWLASGVDERMDSRAGFPRGLATRTARVVTMRTRKMAADG